MACDTKDVDQDLILQVRVGAFTRSSYPARAQGLFVCSTVRAVARHHRQSTILSTRLGTLIPTLCLECIL
jgi:hypothetical protein